jgi:hypothetical protein
MFVVNTIVSHPALGEYQDFYSSLHNYHQELILAPMFHRFSDRIAPFC